MNALLSVRMQDASGRFNLQPSLVWIRVRDVRGIHGTRPMAREMRAQRIRPERPPEERLGQQLHSPPAASHAEPEKRRSIVCEPMENHSRRNR